MFPARDDVIAQRELAPLAESSLELVTCDKKALRLTLGACNSLWKSAQGKAPAAWEGRAACAGCALGAARAGFAVDELEMARRRLRAHCPRCHRKTDRMIQGRLCVSCYNREREIRVGRNRKGTKPRPRNPVGPGSIPIVVDGVIEIRQFDSVASVEEMTVLAALGASKGFAFGRIGRASFASFARPRPPAPTEQFLLPLDLPVVQVARYAAPFAAAP